MIDAPIIISFPPGACGNHLRWLLFLDKQIRNPFTDDQSIQGKVNFILNDVYTENRTWYNWLNYEWKFRCTLDPQIKIMHNSTLSQDDTCKNKQVIFLNIVDFKLFFYHYLHINLKLNGNSIDRFLYFNSTRWNEHIENFSNNLDENMKIFYVDSLYEKNLNYDLYKNIINFLGFDDNYELANQIQNRYYNIRKKSAAEFYSFFTSTQFNDLLLYLQKFSEQDD